MSFSFPSMLQAFGVFFCLSLIVSITALLLFVAASLALLTTLPADDSADSATSLFLLGKEDRKS